MLGQEQTSAQVLSRMQVPLVEPIQTLELTHSLPLEVLVWEDSVPEVLEDWEALVAWEDSVAWEPTLP